MAIAIAVSNVEAVTDNIYVLGSLTASGSYSTGGDTLDFTTVGNQIAASVSPVQVWVGGSTGDAYSWVAGSALNNQKVKINTASNTELGAGSYPSRITGDANIVFEAVFRKMI